MMGEELVKMMVSEKQNIGEMNSNKALGLFYSMFNILVKYGKFSFAFSYSVLRIPDASGKYRYFISSTRRFKIISTVVYAIICYYMAIDAIVTTIRVSAYLLINLIKKMTINVLLVQLFVNYYCLESSKKKVLLLQIFEYADEIQEKFLNAGIQLFSKLQVKAFAYTVCALSILSGVTQLIIFTLKHEPCAEYLANRFLQAVTMDLAKLKTDEMNFILLYICSIMGMMLEFITWGLWYFWDCLRIFSVTYMWMIFTKLNCAVEDGKLTYKDLPLVMDLHLKATKMMNMLNQWISPITFISTIYTLIYVCFWTNYIVQDFHFRKSHIVCIIFVLRNIVIYSIAADVNTKAHKISVWLENCCLENEKLPEVAHNKMAIFIAQVYSRDTVGFKGLNFFTITSSFISGIIGLVMTYTVVITQLIVDKPNNITVTVND